MRVLFLFLTFFAEVVFAQSHPGDFKTGTWTGYWKITGQNEAVPLRLDNFIYQPDGVKDFPTIYAILKTTLGGYDTSEYSTMIYKNIQWDPDQYTLTFDEPQNDLFISGKVFSDPKLHFEGSATNRITQATGDVYLEFLDDEPDDGNAPAPPAFMSQLSGEYVGACGATKGMIQVAAIRTPDAKNSAGLSHYQNIGRFALYQPENCGSDITGKSWCQWKNYTEANYDFTSNKVIFSGPFGADQCQLKENHLICSIDLNFGSPYQCDLQKQKSTPKPFKQYPRKYVLNPTTAQKLSLPNWNPPLNKDLINALSGTFSGYIHNDTLDIYQPIQLAVRAYNATENPHIENSVLMSVKSFQYLGSIISTEFFAQEYETRSAYFRPGYTLTSEHSDSMLQIQEWRMGYVRGVLFSKNFGRVGTFELIKSNSLPAINAAAKFVQSVTGEYKGPLDNPNGVPYNLSWIQLLTPIRPLTVDTNLVSFSGNTNLIFDGTQDVRYGIRNGYYDFYSGNVSWSFGLEETTQSHLFGNVSTVNQLQLMYFSKPLAMGLIPTFGFNIYPKKTP